MSVKKIPEGYNSITPYVVIEKASELIEFLEKAFEAKVNFKNTQDGKTTHADLTIGDSHIMLSEATEQWAPQPTMFYFYVEDTDRVYKKAIENGAESIMEPSNQFYGDRNAMVKDPSGNSWCIATHIEDVSHEELKKRERERQK